MDRLKLLQEALEIAHYARRHRGRRFVVLLDERIDPADLFLDHRFTTTVEAQLYLVTLSTQPPPAPWRAIDLREALENPEGFDPLREGLLLHSPRGEAATEAIELAKRLGASRLMFVSHHLPSALGQRLHFLLPEVRALLPAPAPPLGRLFDLAASGLPVVLLSPGAGCVFEELFTHHGAGVLLGDPVQEEIRPAQLCDTADVFLLLRAEMARGTVRPVHEAEVSQSVTEHLVYTIDDIVVGTARLAPYGDWAELSRFATLPRYRGRGRARQLGWALIDHARALGFSDLFALSIDERMWGFFLSLGFELIDRKKLPTAWQEGYNFARPSRAFHRSTHRRPSDEMTALMRPAAAPQRI